MFLVIDGEAACGGLLTQMDGVRDCAVGETAQIGCFYEIIELRIASVGEHRLPAAVE